MAADPFAKPADHPTFPAPRVGVLLTNLGTPDAPEAWWASLLQSDSASAAEPPLPQKKSVPPRRTVSVTISARSEISRAIDSAISALL